MEEKLHLSISVEKNADRLKTADIICTATNSEKPLFRLEDISKSVHINAIGSYKAHMQEIDPVIIKAATLFVDSKESALKESGDLIKPVNANIFDDTIIKAEIGEYITKGSSNGKYRSDLTIFKSVGLGVQDLYVASALFDRYLQK
jgi:ornithine cyclodeaminase